MAVSNLIYIISSMLIMAIYFNDVLTTEPCTYVSANVVFGKAPSAEPLWSTKVEDFGVCIRSCVRRKPCVSITFDYVTKVCELNRVVLAKEGNRSGKTLMYSAFSQWNVDVDPDCFTRPCGEHEVCIPGGLGSSGSGCSYSCLPVAKPVCPVPTVLNGSRTVGSENIVTCPSGYIGGGSATCQHNKQWTSDIQPCEPVYHHHCTTDDTICKEINGRCDNQNCTCGIGTYNNTVRMCELGAKLEDGNSLDTGFLLLYVEQTWKVICDYKKWNWQATKAVCRDINSSYINGGTFHNKYMGLETMETSTNTAIEFNTIACTGTGASLIECVTAENVRDGDLQKAIGITCFTEENNDDDIYLISEANYQSGMLDKSNHTVMEGVLIVKFRGQTGIVCDSGWKDDDGVTCRTINSTWNEQSKIKANLENVLVQRIANYVKCEDGEPSFFMCKNRGWMHALDCKKAVTLECSVD